MEDAELDLSQDSSVSVPEKLAMGLGLSVQNLFLRLGKFILFGWEVVKAARHLWRRRVLFIEQCEFIGVSSLGVITVAAMFMGSVLGYQLYATLHFFGADAFLGGSVGMALFRELAPVLAGVMVTGRAGAAMAAEISSMRINEQIDALEVMGVDPIEYLATPRVAAGFLMMPIITVYFATVASWAGALVACGLMGMDSTIYWSEFIRVVDILEMVHAVTKGAIFGLVLTWVGCFYGFSAYGGARAVGLATRSTVVSSVLLILLMDYVLTSFLPFGNYSLKAT